MSRLTVTQYGLSPQNGGWDPDWDSSTDKFIGDHGNTLQNGISCALTASARDLLEAKHGDYLQITFPNGFTYVRRFDDTAPEANSRIDFFNAYAFDKQMDGAGEFADVAVITIG